MTEQNQTPDITTEEDTEGHARARRDDVEGHPHSDDDVEGHRLVKDDDSDDSDDDVEGHTRLRG
jgi:hypothetical protein